MTKPEKRVWEELATGAWELKPGFEPARVRLSRWQRFKAWVYSCLS